jgi:adenosylhomocysteine nucleosidase
VTRLGLITGLATEARLARRAVKDLGLAEQALVVCAGPGVERADAAVRGLARYGFNVVASFGLAGGLSPELAAGTLIFPRLVVAEGGPTLAVDEGLREKLLAIFGARARDVRLLLSASAIISSAAAKSRLFAQSGADAVDMESYGVAFAAVSAGLPFVVIRAIADPAERAIPRSAQAGLRPDGSVRALPVLCRAALRPREIPEIMRLARDNRRALVSLRRAARLALPFLLFGR